MHYYYYRGRDGETDRSRIMASTVVAVAAVVVWGLIGMLVLRAIRAQREV